METQRRGKRWLRSRGRREKGWWHLPRLCRGTQPFEKNSFFPPKTAALVTPGREDETEPSQVSLVFFSTHCQIFCQHVRSLRSVLWWFSCFTGACCVCFPACLRCFAVLPGRQSSLLQQGAVGQSPWGVQRSPSQLERWSCCETVLSVL